MKAPGTTLIWYGLGILGLSLLILAAPFGSELLGMVTGSNASSDPQGGMFDGFIIFFGTIPLGILLLFIGLIRLGFAQKQKASAEGKS